MSQDSTQGLPFPDAAPFPDRDSEPYWRAIADGTFQLQSCLGCGALRWPPREICNRCRSFDNAWREVEGRGRLVSWTRTHQVFAPAFRDIVPFYVVQVALTVQPDILMIGGWLGSEPPRSGESVVMELVDTENDYKLPCWRPSPAD